MAMGKRRERQESLWIATAELPVTQGHVFYERVNAVLTQYKFDAFAEQECSRFYKSAVMGRPSLAPGIYFRMLMVGYFEGIDSERGIAWRCADSLSLKSFLGYGWTDSAPDHSTISRTRRLVDVETHGRVFTWILRLLAKEQLVDGKTIGVDGTTLEANAALRSIVRRDTGESYQEFLKRLAQTSGIETPTPEQLTKLDRKRKKKGSNQDWENPNDPDAKITKMKDGQTHLAHKAEHAVDLKTGAILAVTLQDANAGDTTTIQETLIRTAVQLETLVEDPGVAASIHKNYLSEAVTDKGYHSNDRLLDLKELGIRTYFSEPKRGKRNWKNKTGERDAVYANRRRIRGEHGKALLRRRGELVERTFAHCYETGGMRRLHLRGRGNILKRLLVHVAGFNLSLVLRKKFGKGTLRGLQVAIIAHYFAIIVLLDVLNDLRESAAILSTHLATKFHDRLRVGHLAEIRTISTGC